VVTKKRENRVPAEERILMDRAETAEQLRISVRTFHSVRPQLMADGLEEVPCGQKKMYTRASLVRLVEKAVKYGRPLYRAVKVKKKIQPVAESVMG
jgi:hypothetical protein